ncbi:MAG TPA: Ig-like domain-containing protein [Myxococcota bacterium]|nr:Ig-like domain-containing protein [Myxococcota bacterium]
MNLVTVRLAIFVIVVSFICLTPLSGAATNITASQPEVDAFLGGHGGKLVYVDHNDGDKVYWIDFSDMSAHKLSDDGGCSDPLISPDGTRVVYGIYNIISKWPGESADNEGDAYVRALSGGTRTHVAGAALTGKQSFAPHWWVDPASGDEYIVSMDYYEKDTQGASGRATWKQKLDNNQPSGNPVKILEHAFDGGLSRDGTRIGEAYHYLYMAHTMDLGGGDGATISGRMDGGNQCCNASMSPDNNYYIMHLRIDHTGCNIRDESDNPIQTIWKPDGADEMQNPEFSSDPGFSTFTALFGTSYYMYIADTQTGDNLKIAEGNFAVPHLWVASGAPSLTLGAISISFQAVAGGANPVPEDVSIGNSGQGLLADVASSENAGWLQVARTGSGNNQVLQNSIDISGLAAGSYSTTVQVACSNATNSPQEYTVNLEIATAGDDQDPTITIDTPTDGQTVSGSIPIAGTATDNVAVEKVEVKLDDGAFEDAAGTSSWSYTLVTTALGDGPHTVTARASDTSANSASDIVSIQVDNQAGQPSIEIISPNGGEVWETGSTQHIRWSCVALDDVTLRYSTDNGASFKTIEVTLDKSKPGWLDYPWLVPDEPSQECLVFISGYFDEAPTQSAAPFEIKSATDAGSDGGTNDLIISGGCACDQTPGAAGGLPLFFFLLLLVSRRHIAYSRKRG